MENIKNIIKFIDNYLEANNLQVLTPPEANDLLEQHEIFDDYKKRAGLPLRKLLRDGKIPHAYKENGRWYIPHS